MSTARDGYRKGGTDTAPGKCIMHIGGSRICKQTWHSQISIKSDPSRCQVECQTLLDMHHCAEIRGRMLRGVYARSWGVDAVRGGDVFWDSAPSA